MEDQLEQINYEFDKIKDHKPKATNKLKTLGELISSAYKISPKKSIEMWSYIYELNKTDGEKSIKFYTYSVFNKIRNILDVSEYSNLLMMNKEIYLIMRKNSYINPIFILEGLSQSRNFDDLLFCLEIEEQITSNINKEIIHIKKILDKVDSLIFYEKIEQNKILKKYSGIIDLFKISDKNILSKKDFEKYCHSCIEKGIDSLLLNILYDNKNKYDRLFLQNIVLEYCTTNNDLIKPMAYNFKNKELMELCHNENQMQMVFLVDLIFDNNSILYYYFNQKNQKMDLIYFLNNSFLEKLVIKWIKTDNLHLMRKYYIDYWKYLSSIHQTIAQNSMGQLLVQIIEAFTYEVNFYKNSKKICNKFEIPVEILDAKTKFDIEVSVDSTSFKYEKLNDIYKNLFDKNNFKIFLKYLNEINDEINSEEYYIKKFKDDLKDLNDIFLNDHNKMGG